MTTSELSTPAAALSTRFRPTFARIAEGAASRDRDRELAHAEIAALKAEKFGAVRLPDFQGGAGASVPQLFDLLIDLSAADSNVTQALRAHFFVTEGYILSGDARGLERVAAGEIIGNAISEKGTGSVDRYQTALRKEGDRYLLNGTKFYSTGSLYADAIAVAADLDGERVYATVDTDAPGLTQFDDWDGFGQRLTGSGTSVYENVSVAAADLPREDPLVQAVLGRAYSAAFVARATVLSVADALDAVLETPETAEDPELLDRAELAAAEAQVALIPLVLNAVTDLFDVGGASISSESLGLDRHWRNARTLAVHNPVVYKQQAVGKFELTGDGLPYEWNAGVRPK